MSSNSSTPTPTPPSDTPSFQEKALRFFRENKLVVTLVAVGLGVLILFIVLYFTFLHSSRMERFADQFCDCTEQVEGDYFNESKDGFAYHSQLVPCCAEDFSQYGERFTKDEKRLLLQEFQEAVVNKCPQRLNGVLHFEVQ